MFGAVTPFKGHAHLEHRHFLVASGAIYLRAMRMKKVDLHDNQMGRQLQSSGKKGDSPSSAQVHVDVVTGAPLW